MMNTAQAIILLLLSPLAFSAPVLKAEIMCKKVLQLSTVKPTSLSQSIELRSEKNPSSKYDEQISRIAPGDQIKMPSGRKYIVQQVLGGGQLTVVLDIGNGWALRLPRSDQNSQYRAAIDGYFKLHEELKNEGIPVVELNKELSEPPFGLVVKKENFKFTAANFFAAQKNDSVKTLTKKEVEQLNEAFLDFLDTTWKFIDMSDVTPRQIGWNGERWVLFDFYGFGIPGHYPLKNFSEKEIAMHSREVEDEFGMGRESFLPKKLEEEATHRINKIRKNMSKDQDWFERSSDRTSMQGMIDQATPHPLPKSWTRSFSAEDMWFDRDLKGFTPSPNKVSVQIESFIKEKKNFARYSGLVDAEIPVEIYILKTEEKNSYKEIQKMIKELEQQNKAYLSGYDFIVVYKNHIRENLNLIQ